MDTIKYSTRLASYSNPSVTFDIDLLSTDEGTPVYDTMYQALIDTFKEDLKKEKISIARYTSYFRFYGIILWDGVPVTDLSIKFDKNGNIYGLSAVFFTFKGFDFISDLSNVDALVPSAPTCRTQLVADNLKDRFVTYIQYINAVKRYSIGLDNNVYITLDVRPSYQNTINTLMKNASLVGITGLPVVIKDRSAFGVESISCENVSTRCLKQKNEPHAWAYEVPAFVCLPMGNFSIQEISLTPHPDTPESAFPKKCNKIQLKLLGDKESMDTLKTIPPKSSMLKMYNNTLAAGIQKKYLLNYDRFARKNDIILNPNENYDLAIILK